MAEFTPNCELVPASIPYAEKVVRSVAFDGSDLVIVIEGGTFGVAQVRFRSPIGFRVLDERDLCEFWNTYSEPNGWLWRVLSGGWMELEALRPLFNSPSFIGDSLREYLVVDDMCVSVMCTTEPEIERETQSTDA